MNRNLKLFIVYFPVILVCGQVLVNLLYFIHRPAYMASGFYLNLFFGTNGLCAIFFVAFTFSWGFCFISRACAIAEILFAINYAVIGEDNLYNILFQVIVGLLAIVVTFRSYIKRFPLCNLSLLAKFYRFCITSKCDCRKAFDRWQEDIKSTMLKHHHEGKH